MKFYVELTGYCTECGAYLKRGPGKARLGVACPGPCAVARKKRQNARGYYVRRFVRVAA